MRKRYPGRDGSRLSGGAGCAVAQLAPRVVAPAISETAQRHAARVVRSGAEHRPFGGARNRDRHGAAGVGPTVVGHTVRWAVHDALAQKAAVVIAPAVDDAAPGECASVLPAQPERDEPQTAGHSQRHLAAARAVEALVGS